MTFSRIINKIKYIVDYCMANTVFRRKVDRRNGCFDIMSDEKLVDEIVNNGKSLSRFGDGELRLMTDDKFGISFQSNTEELSAALKEVLESKQANLIIGINVGFNDPSEYNKKTQRYFRAFNYRNRDKYLQIIPKGRQYGNSSITRFYIDYDCDDLRSARNRLKNLERIWLNKNILIVEGKYTRLGVGNDLFSKAKNIRRIIIPNTDAFNVIDDIERAVINNRKNSEIVLIAAGPTATVLAHRLANQGIQSVDIGHIDIEYEWMKNKVKKRTRIPGKYTNEIKGKKIDCGYVIQDDRYEKSIIAVVGGEARC